MTKKDQLKEEFIMNFGHAYQAFGLSKLMGHVVALLIYSTEPISLEDIAKHLNRSKGPISQITRRLRDKRLIRRVWHPTSRKDFYEIEPEIFENAFRNNIDLIRNNLKIAEHFQNEIVARKIDNAEILDKRLVEMEKFYELMEKHDKNFLEEWEVVRKKIYKK
ncbi:MAG: MarR family transcriptional regulator [Ignavibacteriae bacterium]|nr:MarR family transcriptional regulator [Ignavibacteriota bacterium]MCB9249485.1 MarR family transcriptional regulator [Ignavibacteriales bacterium]